MKTTVEEVSYGIRYILREFLGTGLNLLILLLAAGIFYWFIGWLCIGLILTYQIINFLVLMWLNPALINKRGKLMIPYIW
ncbi:MAG: hypothetical protein ACTSRC_16010 [Candidatus Helarchaeota archaeon]